MDRRGIDRVSELGVFFDGAMAPGSACPVVTWVRLPYALPMPRQLRLQRRHVMLGRREAGPWHPFFLWRG